MCLFKESAHLISNESQEISGGFRETLQAARGNVENISLTGCVPCGASVLMPLPSSRGARVWTASVKLLSLMSELG